jgi:hypothetical protein
MVHMPLPEGIDQHEVKSRIDPHKDVEGVNPANIGNIVYGHSSFAPCTALATCADRLTGVDLRGKRAVVIGQSHTVGKPIAALLMTRDATVISATSGRGARTSRGRPTSSSRPRGGRGSSRRTWIQPGAIVVDVGVNRDHRRGRQETAGRGRCGVRPGRGRRGVDQPRAGGRGPDDRRGAARQRGRGSRTRSRRPLTAPTRRHRPTRCPKRPPRAVRSRPRPVSRRRCPASRTADTRRRPAYGVRPGVCPVLGEVAQLVRAWDS